MNEPFKILIVDDTELNRAILSDMVTDLGHNPINAQNGRLALEMINENRPDIVLLDIIMPEMDGYEVLRRIKEDNALLHIPVIMISSITDMESIIRCIKLGAEDYLPKPFDPTLLEARIDNSLEKKRIYDAEENLRKSLEEYNSTLQREVNKQVKEVTSAQLSLIFAMAKLAESRDPETGEHLERMAEYCKILSEKLRLLPKYSTVINDAYIEAMFIAAPLHDIGKVGIPDRILQKPGKLDDSEFSVMKTHSQLGANTLNQVNDKNPGNHFIQIGIDIAQHHHEKWDGSGYPYELAGEDIPLSARILALGDVYDALTSRRCYKDAFPHDKSREIIIDGKGKHFDPDIVNAFISAEVEFKSIRGRFPDIDKIMSF